MDDRSFDRLARLLGGASDRRTGLKALAGGILGAGGMAALDGDADAARRGRDRGKGAGPDAAKKRRKACKPACTGGFRCEKVGKRRECVCPTGITCGAACCAVGQGCVDGQCRAASCDPPCANGYVCEGTACVCPSGVECADACCASGQTCENGACTGQPDPDRCIAAGQPCKATGRPCCDGRACASGQGGEADVACYVPKTGACAGTADCVFGTVCTDGRCTPPPPPPPTPVGQLGAACNPATNVCTSPGAVCQAYTGEHPAGLAGTYCTLPLQAVCTGDPDCSCYRCGYPTEAVPGAVATGRRGRATAATTCCHGLGQGCGSSRDCCEGTACEGGTCVAAACTVCKDGSCAYRTIAEAIAKGETDIRIGGGVYDEHSLPLPSGAALTLRNCSASPVIVDARELGRIMAPITTGKTVTVKGITVRNGKVTGNGGGFDVAAGGALVLDGATVTGCYSSLRGGGIHVKGTGAALTTTDSTISGNTAAGGQFGQVGGGIYIDGGDLTATRSRIVENSATGTGARGGGVYLENPAKAEFAGCAIDDNSATQRGGGIGMYRDSAAAGSLSVTGGTISRNEVAGQGGGVWAYDEAANGAHTFEDVRISHNMLNAASSFGGGAYITGTGSPTFDFTGATVIANNGSASPSLANVGGGGLFFEQCTNFIGGGVVIADNAVTDYGGGIATNDGTLTIEGAIRGNTAGGKGGGLYATDNANVTIRGNAVVAGNTAASDGGGIWNYNVLTIEGNTAITGNTATGKGGGIYNKYQLSLKGNAKIRGNSASAASDGVGIYYETVSGSSVTCTDSPTVCSNPTTSPTGASNCYRIGTGSDFVGCTGGTNAVCKGTETTPGSASC